MELKEVASHRDHTRLALAEVGGDVHLAGGAPGVQLELARALHVDGGRVQRFLYFFPESVDLVGLELFVDGQKAGDLTELQLALPLPALRLLLRAQPDAQMGGQQEEDE